MDDDLKTHEIVEYLQTGENLNNPDETLI